jgi:hypothetical protein
VPCQLLCNIESRTTCLTRNRSQRRGHTNHHILASQPTLSHCVSVRTNSRRSFADKKGRKKLGQITANNKSYRAICLDICVRCAASSVTQTSHASEGQKRTKALQVHQGQYNQLVHAIRFSYGSQPDGQVRQDTTHKGTPRKPSPLS